MPSARRLAVQRRRSTTRNAEAEFAPLLRLLPILLRVRRYRLAKLGGRLTCGLSSVRAKSLMRSSSVWSKFLGSGRVTAHSAMSLASRNVRF
jgi:hypothetical protein